MASLIDLYKGSEFENAPNKNKDKTPLTNEDIARSVTDQAALEQARGGKVNTTKYSDRVNYGN